jgi:hypothetical protein
MQLVCPAVGRARFAPPARDNQTKILIGLSKRRRAGAMLTAVAIRPVDPAFCCLCTSGDQDRN